MAQATSPGNDPAPENTIHNKATSDSASDKPNAGPGTGSMLDGKELSGSDGEHERPVREKLKKTSIASMPNQAAPGPTGDYVLPDASGPSDEVQESAEGKEHGVSEKNGVTERGPTAESRGKPVRKRSYDDTELGGDEEAQRGTRKRSRELSKEREDDHTSSTGPEIKASSPSEDALDKGKDTVPVQAPAQISKEPSTPDDVSLESFDNEGEKRETLLSPKKKRSRDQFDKDVSPAAEIGAPAPAAEAKEHESLFTARASRTTREEPEKKRHRDTSKEATKDRGVEPNKIPSTSGFSNTSAVSPFGSISKEKSSDASSKSAIESTPSSQPQTSSAAFAKSGFGALASSSTSPFGAFGGGSPQPPAGGFGGFGGSKPAGSVFGGGFQAQTKSAFGGGATSFGKVQGGFGGPIGGFGGRGGDFSSKAAPGIVGLGEKPTKPFGAPAEKDEEGDSNDEGDGEASEAGEDDESKEGATFQKKEVETGEEGEETLFANRAKLFYFNKHQKAWKERGNGTLKLNMSTQSPSVKDDDGDSHSDRSATEERDVADADTPKRSARLIMRADGVLRVVLNVPIFKGMKFGDKDGNAPTGRAILTTAQENGEAIVFQIRLTAVSSAVDLYNQVQDIQKDL